MIMNKFVITVFVCAVLFVCSCSIALASPAFTEKNKKNNKIFGGWELDRCPSTEDEKSKLTVALRFYIRLRNLHLLDDESSYEPSTNDDQQQQQQQQNDEMVLRRLKKATSIFMPTSQDVKEAENEINHHFGSDTFTQQYCAGKKSSETIFCQNVPVTLVEKAFSTSLCFYHHETHPETLHRLFSLDRPRFQSHIEQKSSLIEHITGISPYALPKRSSASRPYEPPVAIKKENHFPVQEAPPTKQLQKGTKKVNNNNIKQSSFSSSPSSTTEDFPSGQSAAPSILRISKTRIINEDDGSETFQFDSVDVALNCQDASPAYYDAATSKMYCFNSSDEFLPVSIAIRVHDENGGNLLQPSYSISSSSVKCFGAGENYGDAVTIPSAAVCRCSTASQIANLVPFQRYSVSAMITFNFAGGTSSMTPIFNYYYGKNFPTPSAHTNPGEQFSSVTPILTIPSKPVDIRNFYGVDDTERVSKVSPLVSQGVLEFAQFGRQVQGYNQNDVKEFIRQIGDVNSDPNNLPITYIGTKFFPDLAGDECALDIEMLMGIATNTPTVFWSVSITGGNRQGEFSSFVDALANMFSAIANKEVAGFPAPYPTSFSISYGLDEDDAFYEGRPTQPNTPNLVNRCDTFLQILTKAGITVFASSGDSGSTSEDASMSTTQFPAVLPYAVGVGATSFYKKPVSPEVPSPKLEEVVCSALDANIITSGGSISTHFSQPSYQKSAINQNYRAVPDVSALGSNLFTIVGGAPSREYGTSASAPIFAAILTLINNRLRLNGNETLRNAHEVFYQNENTNWFTDITSGNNCGTRANNNLGEFNFPTLKLGQCYFAGSGYDAVTGLGTPNFANIILALTGHTVAPNTPSPYSNNGAGGASQTIFDFISDHWIYFAAGGGGVLFLILACCCYLRRRSREQEAREALLFSSRAQIDDSSPRSGRRNINYGGDGGALDNQSLSSRNGGTRYGAVQ